MHLYIAGLYASSFNIGSNLYNGCPPAARALREQVSHHLESYHYIAKGKYLKNIRKDGVKVFLDSGAFSAFSLGAEIDIGEYAEWMTENRDVILMASVLDAIGDHEKTLANQHELERRGCPVLPCFHFGEPFDLCEYYISNYEYITIGGMVPVPNQKLEPWLDELWAKVLTDKDGIARRKVHGFGLTSRPLMTKYPWYSVDSSSWVQVGMNGSIVFPEIPAPVNISGRSPRRKDFMAHYDTLPPPSKKHVTDLLNYYGLVIDDVREDYKARWALNAFTFDRLGKLLGDDHWRKPFRGKLNTLF